MSLRSIVLVAALAAPMLAGRAIARADERLGLDLGATVAAGLRIEESGEREVDEQNGPYLRMARLRARAGLDGVGWALVQTELQSGRLVLLDAVVALAAVDGLTLRVGRFKTPVSSDLQISLPRHPLTTRPMLIRHVPRRHVGVDAMVRIPVGRARLDLEIGLFDPSDLTREAPDKLLASRVGLDSGFGLSLHAAYGQLVLESSSDNRDLEAPAHHRWLDFALAYENHALLGRVEGVVAFDEPGESPSWGGMAMVAYTLGESRGRFAVQPALAYDVWRAPASTEHRGRGALNFLLAGRAAIVRFDYQVAFRGQGVGHRMMVELQAGL